MKTRFLAMAGFGLAFLSACGDSPLENTPAATDFSRRVSVIGGTGLSGTYGNFVSGVPEVRVTTRDGLPLSGVAVAFMAEGGGRVTGAAALTDIQGLARPTSWRFGMSGTQALRVEVDSAAALTISGSAQAPPAGTFRIQVRYAAGTEPTAAQRAAFDAAASTWSRLILRGGAPYQIHEVSSGCGDLNGETVDGVVITADLREIDGAGQILGQAGPCILRDADLLPAQGMMQFDTADLATVESRGQLEALILHEMGHVLGFGTLWDVGAGIKPTYLLREPTTDPTFSGPASRAAYFGLAGGGAIGAPVPVENGGSVGTALAHWRESVFGQELMTGWLNPGITPLSALTLAQFRDLGYTVNDALGDSYTFAAAVQASVQPLQLIERALTTPLIVINRSGRIVRTVDRQLK